MKAKPIKHGDYIYRSRIEARWGELFDCFGLDFTYEPKRFDTRHGGVLA